eukprot:SAG31_NODE_161_length_21899_cov_16.832844_13_plen_95_part_00
MTTFTVQVNALMVGCLRKIRKCTEHHVCMPQVTACFLCHSIVAEKLLVSVPKVEDLRIGDTFSISALHLAIKVPYFSNSGHKNEKVTSYLRIGA